MVFTTNTQACVVDTMPNSKIKNNAWADISSTAIRALTKSEL